MRIWAAVAKLYFSIFKSENSQVFFKILSFQDKSCKTVFQYYFQGGDIFMMTNFFRRKIMTVICQFLINSTSKSFQINVRIN